MSFRRAQAPTEGAAAAPPPPPATAPSSSPAGGRRASSGCASLDRALFGGLALGSVTLLVRDAPSRHARALSGLFAAEGVLSGHRLILVGCRAGRRRAEFLRHLPGLAGAQSASSAPSEEPLLRIAHEYRKYLGSSPSAGALGHPLRLNRPLSEEALASNAPLWLDVSSATDSLPAVLAALEAALEPPAPVSRVLLTDLDALLLARPQVGPSSSSSAQAEVLHFFLALRSLVRTRPAVVALAELPPSIPRTLRSALGCFAAAVLEVEPLPAEGRAPELAGLEALLRVRKLEPGLVPRGAAPSRALGLSRGFHELSLAPLGTVAV